MMQDLHAKVIAGVHAILGPAGLLESAGMMHSPIQLQYALQVAEGLTRAEDPSDERTRINMLEAQTGTGKTIGYLVPLLLFSAYTGERVMVSTYTRMLQKQILDKDAALVKKWVAELTGVHLTVARRIGRRNYVSFSRCEALLEALCEVRDTPEEAIGFLETLLRWGHSRDSANSTFTGVLDDFLAEYDFQEMPPGLSRNQLVLELTCPEEEQLPYLRDVITSKEADVVVVNHALLMMHAYRWCQVLDENEEGWRQASVAVVDEADRVADAAASIMGADLTLHGLVRQAKEAAALLPGLSNTVGALESLYAEVLSLRAPGTDVLALLTKDSRSKSLIEHVTLANNAAREAAGRLREQLLRDQLVEGEGAKTVSVKAAALLDTFNDLQVFTEALHAHDNTALVSWSPIREFPSLRLGKPIPGRLLSRLWRTRKQDTDAGQMSTMPVTQPLYAILFTSATLSVPGKALPVAFDDFAISVGVSRFPLQGETDPLHRAQVDLYRQYEPSLFGRLSFVLADPRIPNPSVRADDFINDKRWSTNPEWLDYAAHMIRQAWFSGERVLVLTLSYGDTEALAARLRQAEHERCLVVHSEGEALSSLRRRFEELDRAVLLTPSGWEGLDMPGLVKNLVITRLPFSPPGNAESEIFRAHLFAKGMAADKIDSIIRMQAVHQARRKLAQGIGRAIRARTDEATIWVADPRFPVPEEIAGSLDTVILEAPPRNIQHSMLSCIPSRFRDAFAAARICLRDGGCFRPN